MIPGSKVPCGSGVATARASLTSLQNCAVTENGGASAASTRACSVACGIDALASHTSMSSFGQLSSSDGWIVGEASQVTCHLSEGDVKAHCEGEGGESVSTSFRPSRRRPGAPLMPAVQKRAKGCWVKLFKLLETFTHCAKLGWIMKTRYMRPKPWVQRQRCVPHRGLVSSLFHSHQVLFTLYQPF